MTLALAAFASHLCAGVARDRDGAERVATVAALDREADEAAASLLGILWEAELGQPALASFLDQNWLEGLERSAAPHFTSVFRRLQRLGVIDLLALDNHALEMR